MKRFLNTLVLILVLATYFVQPVFAATNNNKDYNIQEIRNQLELHGVDETSANCLIDKLLKGEAWDSLKPEYQNLKPQIIRDGYEKTIYPDGSISVQIYEEVPYININTFDESKSAQPLAIISKKGVKAIRDLIVFRMEFKVDYQRNTSTKKAYISSIREYDAKALGGSVTPDTVGHLQGWRNPTHAWYAVYFNGFQDISGGRYWLKLYVNGNGNWQDSNF